MNLWKSNKLLEEHQETVCVVTFIYFLFYKEIKLIYIFEDIFLQ